ncbi:MAG TPA: alpha-amylase/4-alpha-glucanotransferase domain-containing protein [Candidatus Eisenbacteria bacterium]|nr:alpha-amylase/4-alpha-glucanotransferase domain-containing protein [Candidatus Eisenbacteria bacterium]
MHRVSLVMIVHDHQPVGNFDGVFRDAYDDAYGPFLGFLESHPEFRLALHTSGPLLDWMAANEPGYLEGLRALVARGQVEPWGGGLYEPILPAIPEEDRYGQIRALADRLEAGLGMRPRGLWLTERVWEPGLASSLVKAGVEYTAVDDAHFVAAGLERDQLWGRFTTEDQGASLTMFPIHRELRYSIPFGEPKDTIDILRRVAQSGPDRIAVLGDDGEKFGVWPGTRKRCYEERWLERFSQAIAAEDWIEVITPAEAVERHRSLGLVYLPTASYHEMQEWALPPAAQHRYHAAAAALKPTMGDAALDLLRGGHWRAFLARYPESNRIHKRMLRASRTLWTNAREHDDAWREARDHLWRAQCNDAYWHGVFGGLYLPHLRSALYRELIAAERRVPGGAGSGDLDLDGADDALIQGPRLAAWLSTRGARLWGLDDRTGLCNYIDTLARRPEAYHEKLRKAAVGGGEAETIHAGVRWKEPGHARLLEAYDPHERDAFLDQWSEGGATHDWAEDRFDLDASSDRVRLTMDEGAVPRLEKTYRLDSENGLEVSYRLSSGRERHGTLQVTVNLGLHVFRADDRWVEIDGRRADAAHWGAEERRAGVSMAAFVDAWADRRLEIDTDRPAEWSRAPIETISLSEAGAEAVFQGVESRYRFEVDISAGGEWRVAFRLKALRAAQVPV